jgi:hypothetical protein
MGKVRRAERPPDQAALTWGACRLFLAAVSAVPWGRVVASVSGGPAAPTWYRVFFLVVSLLGFLLGTFALWSAVKAWLRDDSMSTAARLGVALGFAAIILVVALGPCGPQACSPDLPSFPYGRQR